MNSALRTAVVLTSLACAVLAAGCASTVAEPAQASPAPAPAGPTYDVPLGIALDELRSPHPVHFLPLEIEGQRVRMAYMDIRPAGSTPAGGTPAGGTPAGGTPAAGADRGTVLLLHGKNFWGGYWAGTIAALRDAGFRVVVPDQVGFGRSSKPDVHYSFDLLAANTAKLLDHLGVDKAAVVGHSMGGMLAVRFARTYPQRVTKLILENPIGLEDWRAKGVPPRATEDVYAVELRQTGETVRSYFRQAYFAHTAWRPEWEWLVEPAARVALSGEFPRWAKAAALTYQMIYEQPVRHEFPLIAVPTLLVIGQADRTALGRNFAPEPARAALGNYPQLGKDAARDIPGAKLVELDGVGHIPHIEAPERFHEPLLAFLK